MTMDKHTHKDGKFYYGTNEVSIEDMLKRLNELEHQNSVMCGTFLPPEIVSLSDAIFGKE